MSSFKCFPFATILISLGLLFAAADVSALSSGGIGGRPANPDPSSPRSQSIFIFNANKGESKKDTILVANNSDKKQEIELYAVDGIVTNTGSFTCAQQSEVKQGVGAWIAVDKPVVVLEAGKTEEVGFNLAMPQTADVGEHNGCLVFQVAEDGGETTGNVRVRTRQAIRVVATVPGDLKRSVEITNFSTGNKDGKLTYTLNLKNNGNVSADIDAKVYLKSLFGTIVDENGGGYPILANRQLDLTFINDSRPFFGGLYYASAEIAYDDRAGTFGTRDRAHLIEKDSGRQVLFIAPTIAAMVVLALLAGVLGGFITWLSVKRRSKLTALKTWQMHTIKRDESIQSIADKYNISWKKLATMNGIMAPYVLKEGDVIRVPEKQKNVKVPKDTSINK